MNEFTRIANDYFNAFDGRRYYPKLLSLYWLAWIATLVAWVWSMYLLFDPVWMQSGYATGTTLVLEVLFFLTYVAISDYKTRSLYAEMGLARRATPAELDTLRCAHLCRAFGRPSQEFATLAREVQDLLEMLERFRPMSEVTLEGLWRGIHDPERKARLMGIVIGALAIFVSLLVIGLPSDSPSIVEILLSEDFSRAFVTLMVLTVVAFGIWQVLRLNFYNLVEIVSPWGARFLPSSSFTRLKIKYLMRDLVRLHKPAIPSTPRRRAPLRSSSTLSARGSGGKGPPNRTNSTRFRRVSRS